VERHGVVAMESKWLRAIVLIVETTTKLSLARDFEIVIYVQI
jgi:hypothetical protein